MSRLSIIVYGLQTAHSSRTVACRPVWDLVHDKHCSKHCSAQCVFAGGFKFEPLMGEIDRCLDYAISMKLMDA